MKGSTRALSESYEHQGIFYSNNKFEVDVTYRLETQSQDVWATSPRITAKLVYGNQLIQEIM